MFVESKDAGRTESESDNRTLARPATLSGSLFRTIPIMILCSAGIVWAAELFPYNPPSTRQAPITQQGPTRGQLTPQDLQRIEKYAEEAKRLSAQDRTQLKETLRSSRDSAADAGRLDQVQYYTELLKRIP